MKSLRTANTKAYDTANKLQKLGYNILGYNNWAVVYQDETGEVEVMHLGVGKTIHLGKNECHIQEYCIVYKPGRWVEVPGYERCYDFALITNKSENILNIGCYRDLKIFSGCGLEAVNANTLTYGRVVFIRENGSILMVGVDKPAETVHIEKTLTNNYVVVLADNSSGSYTLMKTLKISKNLKLLKQTNWVENRGTWV